MRVAELDYCLPVEAIAQHPLEPRDASRMLVLNPATGDIADSLNRELPCWLKPGDLLVFNKSRVSARRVFGSKGSGARVELFLLRDVMEGTVEAIVKPAKRLKTGTIVTLESGLSCEIVAELEGGLRHLRFFDAATDWRSLGEIPLPPYISRKLETEERYQTVYADNDGSAAAPTAGLHFTPELLREIENRGVETAYVTLDVSLDTFRPMQVEDSDEHKMHGERYEIPDATAQAIRECKGRVIAVGTTTVRALESAATGCASLTAGPGETKLFITPGYEFKIVDGLLTNFHLPKSTLLLMVSALCGVERLLSAYESALQAGYRFLSFGDSMLILEERK